MRTEREIRIWWLIVSQTHSKLWTVIGDRVQFQTNKQLPRYTLNAVKKVDNKVASNTSYISDQIKLTTS